MVRVVKSHHDSETGQTPRVDKGFLRCGAPVSGSLRGGGPVAGAFPLSQAPSSTDRPGDLRAMTSILSPGGVKTGGCQWDTRRQLIVLVISAPTLGISTMPKEASPSTTCLSVAAPGCGNWSKSGGTQASASNQASKQVLNLEEYPGRSDPSPSRWRSDAMPRLSRRPRDGLRLIAHVQHASRTAAGE